MRWRRPQFALFAVILAVAATFGAGTRLARAVGTKASQVFLTWDRAPEPRPGGTAHILIVVDGDTVDQPTGSVVLEVDGAAQPSRPLTHGFVDSSDNHKQAATDAFDLSLSADPHRLVSKYAGDDKFAAAKDDVIGLAVASLSADAQSSKQGDFPAYRFRLQVWDKTPDDEKPTGKVTFSDDAGGTSTPLALTGSHKAGWEASWRPLPEQPPGDRTIYAQYQTSDGGDDTFFPVAAPPLAHTIVPKPSDGTTAVATSTTKKPAVKAPPTTRHSATTAVLGPINPSTTTTLFEDTTSSTFGSFPTNPRSSGQSAQNTSNNQKNNGPPLVIVFTTLAALGVLGGIAAFRRYRGSGIDWF